MNGCCVLARREQLLADAFREFLESLAKYHLHAKPPGDLNGNPAVLGASHSIIHLVQAQHVRAPDGLGRETFFEKRPTLPFLNVPGHKPNPQRDAALIIH